MKSRIIGRTDEILLMGDNADDILRIKPLTENQVHTPPAPGQTWRKGVVRYSEKREKEGTHNIVISLPRITYFFKILITVLILLLYSPLTGFVISAEAEDSIYLIHVSSFRRRKSAEIEVSNLSKHGVQVFYKYESVKGKGKWFRVYIGTFKNRQEAMEKGVELLRKGIISYYKPRKVDHDFLPDEMTVEFEELEKREAEPAGREERAPSIEVPQKPIEKAIGEPPSKPRAAEREITLREKERAEGKPSKGYSPSASLFSLSLNVGVYTSSSARDFKITEQTPSGTRRFSFTGDTAQTSLELGMRVYRNLNLYGRCEYAFAEDIDMVFVSLGPKLRLDILDWAFLYLKGGVVYGDFDFDGAPGEFEDDFGWETGFGVDLLKSQFKIGFDVVYRDIEFDYKVPGVPGISASKSSIDVSGFSISASVTYFF